MDEHNLRSWAKGHFWMSSDDAITGLGASCRHIDENSVELSSMNGVGDDADDDDDGGNMNGDGDVDASERLLRSSEMSLIVNVIGDSGNLKQRIRCRLVSNAQLILFSHLYKLNNAACNTRELPPMRMRL